jgi:hypothetical protein
MMKDPHHKFKLRRIGLFLLAGCLGAALACNFSAVTPVPPTQTLTATAVSPTGAPVTGTPATGTPEPDTPTPTPPTATVSPCVENAAGRTQGCDEFTPQLVAVRRFDNAGVPLSACQGWCPLSAGDLLETDGTGQAELNFSDCWPGRLFLYQASLAQAMVSVCTKADFCPGGNCSNPPAMCVPNGALYTDKCAGEFNPVTGSARIEKSTATYLITYRKEGDVTTVILMDGELRLRPVAQVDPVRLGDLMQVRGGQFLFTMPDESLSGVGGLAPRVPHSVEQLPQVVQELGLEDWVLRAAETARQSGVLPENWPSSLSGLGVDVVTGGGQLSNPETQLWLYQAINWSDLPVSDRRMRLFIRGEPVNALDINYLPARAAEALKPQALAIRLVFPEGNAELEESAKVIAEYLARAGISAELTPVAADQLARLIRVYEAGQQPYLYLTR